MPADDERTLASARALAAAVPAGLPVRVSPLRRCLQLADALAALRPDLHSMPDARIAEFDFGEWEGRPWDAIGEAPLSAWTRDFADHRAGGGESVRLFMARVDDALEDLAPHDAALWITHAGVIRAVRLLAGGIALPTAAQWPADAVPPGGWEVVKLQPRASQR